MALKKLEISSANENSIRTRCINFLMEFAKQLRQRLPEKVLKKLSVISVSNAIRYNKESLIPLLEELQILPTQASKIEMQWRSLESSMWSCKDDTNEFWGEVYNFKDAVGHNPYKELADFALQFLVLPISNADVERLFSVKNSIKTKVRNRMQTEMLNSIIRIRSKLKREKTYCYAFKISNELLDAIQHKFASSTGNDDLDIETLSYIDNDI